MRYSANRTMLIYEYGSDPQSYEYYLSRSKIIIKPEKDSGPFGIWTHDLCVTGAALYQLGFPNRPSKWWINDCKYMEIIYVNCGWRNEYGSDPHIYEHYSRSSENNSHGYKSLTGLNFFRRYFHCYLSSVHNREDRLHIRFFNRSSCIWFSYIYIHLMLI